MNSKRPLRASTMSRPRKRPRCEDGRWYTRRKEHQFRVLLQNSTTTEEFEELVRKDYDRVVNQRRSLKSMRRINRQYQNKHFTKTQLKEIRSKVNLHDGSAETDVCEGMWDLNDDHDVLKELPNEYTFETTVANLIDNSLQNVLSNDEGERRLISVELLPSKILIFDSGRGMDGTAGNLEKWGKILASLHQSIGGEPPYSMPFFGMFGYGGPVAATCFGKRAIISSKPKNCDKVLTLNLEREPSESGSCSEKCWRTKGGSRDPLKDETEKSLHGSFTKVEILDPKVKTLDIKRLRCKLKDIFFPYIKCAEVSGTTSPRIEFQVNGIDLSEVQGGEEAVTNLHSCNDPDFVLHLHFSISQDSSSKGRQNERVFTEANARLKCVYFPIVEGKENITRILDALDADGCGIRESFESFSRVSVRSLGRLLPDARWALLPFMEPNQKTCKKGHGTGNFSRVKCFIDTDSGFYPASHKTDLVQHHPYTKALKNFGKAAPEIENGVQVEICKDGKKLTLVELEEQYNAWVLEMHDRYDEEPYQKLPSSIDLLSNTDCKELGIYGALPTFVLAGNAPPSYIVVVIRPKSFLVQNCCNRLDQRFIIKDNIEMALEIKYRVRKESEEFTHIYSTRLSPSSHKGLHGLYLFPLGTQPRVFNKVGFITFSFFLEKSRDIRIEHVVEVRSLYAARWKVLNNNKDRLYTIRVGSCFEPLYVSCINRYDNYVLFKKVPELNIELNSNGKVLAHIHSKKVDIEPGNSTIKIKDIFVKSSELDDIRPNYEATLTITRAGNTHCATFPCRVIPGTPEKINIHPPELTRLIPGQIIKELSLEVLDEYGNHVEEGEIIFLRVEGLSFQDGSGVVYVGTDCMKKVDGHGFVELSNSLKVSEGYSKNVSLSVIFKEKVIFHQQFETELRDVRSLQKELEDDLITSATAMNDRKRELDRLRCVQLHIQQEIKDLQGNLWPLSANASRTSQLLMEKKLELAKTNKHLEEVNETYRRATEKFLMARDKIIDENLPSLHDKERYGKVYKRKGGEAVM